MHPDTPSIVIVDDASEVRLLVRTRLRMSGRLRVVGEGANGAEAVALAQQHQPSLMLLDVSMPGMDGLEALPLVLAASPHTRVVMYSGFEEQGLAEKAEQMGAAAFIEKSVPVDSLVDRLAALAGAAAQEVAGHEPGPADAVASAGTSSGDRTVLDEHLERFREVFDEAAIGMATMTLTGHLVRANRALAALLQRTTEDLVGLFYGDLTNGHEELLLGVLDDIVRRPLDVVQLEHGVTGAPDHRRVRATLAPVRDSAGRPLYLFLQVQDVTVERAAVEELRKSEERFRLLVEAVQDYAIFMLSPEGVVVSWNAGAERSNGYKAEEIIGRHFRVFYPPEQQEARHPEHELELALRDGSYSEEGKRVRKDGEHLLGERRDHRGVRRLRPAHRLREGDTGHHRASQGRREPAAERGALPPPRGERSGLRHLHARRHGPHRQLEHRCPTDQGLHRRGDRRPALPGLLPARRPGAPPPRARARARGSSTVTTRRRAGASARTGPCSGPTS